MFNPLNLLPFGSSLLLAVGMILLVKSSRICSRMLLLNDVETNHQWIKTQTILRLLVALYGCVGICCWANFNAWMLLFIASLLLSVAALIYLLFTLAFSSFEKLKQSNHSHAFMTEIFQTMGNALIVADKNGIITLVNSCLEKLLLTSNEALIGRSAEELFVGEISDMPGVQHENGLLLPSLRELPVLVTISHTLQDGNPLQIIVIQDIRKQKENEIRLKEYLQKIELNNTELEQFSYVAAHDLKAPLRAIQNLTEFIEDDMELVPEGVQKHFLLIKGRIKRMEKMINGLLEYARTGKQGVELEITDVRQLIKDIVENLDIRTRSEVMIETELPVIYTHKLLLEQVFTNLISNAYKYNSNPEPIIRIKSKTTGNLFEFSVSDNGPGIPEDSKETIFGIFQTLHQKDSYESTGIGLSIVKKIVKETGCEIHVESDPGEGCTFRFTWPHSGAA